MKHSLEKMTNPVSCRLLEFFSSLDISSRKIEIEVGLANGTIGKISKGISPSIDKIELVFRKYEKLNANWLFKGEGDMLDESKSDAQVNAHVDAQVTQKAAEPEAAYNCAGCKEKSRELAVCQERVQEYKERIQELIECVTCKEKDKRIEQLEHQIKRYENDIDWLKTQIDCQDETEPNTKRRSA